MKTLDGSATPDINNKKNGKNKKIYLKIIFVIIMTIGVITLISLLIGANFLSDRLSDSIEQDMMVVADIADRYVSAEIKLLKIDAKDAALKIDGSYKSGDRERALEYCYGDYHMFGGLAVYSETELVDSYGELSAPADLFAEPFMQDAFKGGQGISSTMYNPDGTLVMYISAPMDGGHVLAAVMPGLYFSNLLSEFAVYESGHIFIDDADGNIIVNIRHEWVEDRVNFINIAKTNIGYSDLGKMVNRGISGERGTTRFTVDGVLRFCAFRPVTASEEGWFLGIIAPVTESPLRGVTGSMLLVGAITLGLSLIASIIAAKVLKKPYDEAESYREAAEIASLTKTNFLANMSHEMRTPLNVVIGLTDLILLDEKTTGENSVNVNKIRSAGLTLLGIVNDILDISKIESGKLTLTAVEYDTASLLNDAIMLNIIRIEDKSIDFILDISENMYSQLYGDDLRVKQILSNLLSNAFKYTKEGSVKLKVECERDGGDVWMSVALSDTGVGIRPDDLNKLFSDYNQVDTKANRKIEGTGLGLSITKRLVEMMDGAIEVKSEYGKGTTFTVRIKQGFVDEYPIGSIIANNLRSFQYSEEKRSDVSLLIPANLDYARVLVVDDFQTNLDVAVGLMRRYKLKVDCLMNGQDTVERIRSMKPIYDAIFMDHMMPGMDGMEATKKIRELDSDYAKSIPIICLTANAIIGNEKLFLENGFQAFLSKPIDIKKLDAMLKQWVRKKSRESSTKGAAYSYEPAYKTESETQPEQLPEADAQPAPERVSTQTPQSAPAERLTQAPAERLTQVSAEKLTQASEDKLTQASADKLTQASAEKFSKPSAVNPASMADLGSALAFSEKHTEIHIPGIDEKKGLSLYAYDFDIYLPVLRSYAENMPAVIESLRNVSEKNLSVYAINVHGLKGASGSIGATEVREKAAKMEETAKAGDLSGVIEVNESLIQDALKLGSAIQDWLNIYDKINDKPRSSAPDTELLRSLEKYCGQFNMNGVDDIMDELESVVYAKDNDLIFWLREKVDITDFSAISARLKNYLAQA